MKKHFIGSIGAATAVVVCAFSSGNAVAQGSMAVAQAQTLYDEANKLLAAKQYEQACPKFAESHRLDPGVGTLLRLATCYEQLGKTATAWATLLEAEALAHKSNDGQREKKAKLRAEQLLLKLARLNVIVPEAVASISGLTVKRDGEPIGKGQWGQPLPVDPGTYKIEVSAPGKVAWATSVEVKAAGKTVDVEIPTLADAPAQVVETRPDKSADAVVRPPTSASSTPAEPAPGSTDGGGAQGPDTPSKKGLSHSGQPGAFFRADVDGKLRGMVGVFGISYGIGDWLEIAAAGLVGKDKGVWAGGTGYFLRGSVKPRVTVGSHLFIVEGVQFGLHASGGLQWDPVRNLGLFIDAGVSYWPAPRAGYESVVFVPSAGVQGRL